MERLEAIIKSPLMIATRRGYGYTSYAFKNDRVLQTFDDVNDERLTTEYDVEAMAPDAKDDWEPAVEINQIAKDFIEENPEYFNDGDDNDNQ